MMAMQMFAAVASCCADIEQSRRAKRGEEKRRERKEKKRNKRD
jgi:hypothetical protein